MTIQQWNNAVDPKVQGTINLHKLLPDLDFFIMLSSVTGVLGNLSQANYSAGGTFQDNFARYRASLGLPAVSIDLGSVKSVGFVAEASGAAAINERLEKIGTCSIELDQVFRIMDSAIRNPIRSIDSSQVITCLAPSYHQNDSVLWKDQRFSPLRSLKDADHGDTKLTSGDSAGTAEFVRDSLAKASTLDEASEVATAALTKKLGEIFTISAEEIDKSLPVSHYGVDSLVAVGR